MVYVHAPFQPSRSHAYTPATAVRDVRLAVSFAERGCVSLYPCAACQPANLEAGPKGVSQVSPGAGVGVGVATGGLPTMLAAGGPVLGLVRPAQGVPVTLRGEMVSKAATMSLVRVGRYMVSQWFGLLICLFWGLIEVCFEQVFRYVLRSY